MQTRTVGASLILLVAAVIVFVLAGFGVTIGTLDELDEVSFGLALGFLSFIV